MELSPPRLSPLRLSLDTSSPLNLSLQTDEENQDLNKGMKNLFTFAFKGNAEKVREILTEFKELVNCKDKEGRTPLYLAASKGKKNVVQLLIEEFGADKEAATDLGGTAFWYFNEESICNYKRAACKGGHPEVVQYLADIGANINVQGTNRGDNLLHSPTTIATCSNTPGGNSVSKILKELYRKQSNSNNSEIDDTVTINPAAFALESDEEDLTRRKRQRTDLPDKPNDKIDSGSVILSEMDALHQEFSKFKEESNRIQNKLIESNQQLQSSLDGAREQLSKLTGEHKSLYEKNAVLEDELNKSNRELQKLKGINISALSLDVLNSLKEELKGYKLKVKEAIKESKNCVICFENTKNVMFLPCKHFHFCNQCADAVMRSNKKCPYCKQEATDFTIVQF